MILLFIEKLWEVENWTKTKKAISAMRGKAGNDKERGLHECVSGYVLVPPAQINCTLLNPTQCQRKAKA